MPTLNASKSYPPMLHNQSEFALLWERSIILIMLLNWLRADHDQDSSSLSIDPPYIGSQSAKRQCKEAHLGLSLSRWNNVVYTSDDCNTSYIWW